MIIFLEEDSIKLDEIVGANKECLRNDRTFLWCMWIDLALTGLDQTNKAKCFNQ